jgi:hypothetical protein
VIITIVVATVVVVPHDVKNESFRSQRCFAVFALNFSDGPWNGTLDEVRASIREVIRSCHGRPGQAEQLLEGFLEME